MPATVAICAFAGDQLTAAQSAECGPANFSAIRRTVDQRRTILLCRSAVLTGPEHKRRTVVKRALLVAVSGAVIVVGGLAGCSSNKSSSESASSATETAKTAMSSASSAATSATDAAKGNPAPGQATVTIDGADQAVNGTVVCTAAGGNFNIAIGEAATGVAVVLAEDASAVHSVGLGNVNGVTLGFQEGAPGGTANATKDGQTYKVTGTATGVDMANPMQPVTKPFEVDVTCP
jgi:ipoprotein LpqH